MFDFKADGIRERIGFFQIFHETTFVIEHIYFLRLAMTPNDI